MSEGSLLGPNLIARLLRILPWAEWRMGNDPPQHEPTPQVLGGGPVHIGKLGGTLAFDDATGVTVTIWTGKPAAVTSPARTVDNVVISELLMTEGELANGSAVRIQRIDGKWFVVGAPC